jgi:hypothetical protein
MLRRDVSLREVFSTEIFMARGHAYLWTPWLVIAEIVSNAVIAIALLVIGVRLVRRVRAGEPEGLARAGAWAGVLAFALASTHLLDVWVTWTPIYGIDAAARGLVALVALTAMFRI